ncbi:MAG: NAD-dependent epimerase/dehydratase family protein [Nocardioidaceae bacterium]
MRLLVLGGTRFVGRAVVEEALRRGDQVTTVNRGVSGTPAAGARAIHVDRTDHDALAASLGDDEWDAVIDTWSSAPCVVRASASLLADRVGHYGYVSSRSVYRWPMPSGLDESAPVVDGDPASTDDSDYAAAKRGAELAALEAFPDRALLARAGLVLGPYENVGRLPWWLGRTSRGGRVLAPGPQDRQLQYVDARDLAAWMLDAAQRGLGGAFNAVSKPGHTTIGELLATCNDVTGRHSELVWVPAEAIEAAGLSGWTQLPIWVPPTGELAGLHDGDVSAAHAEGLRCRPMNETVADTWLWLQDEGFPPPMGNRPVVGLDPDLEQRVLDALTRK